MDCLIEKATDDELKILAGMVRKHLKVERFNHFMFKSFKYVKFALMTGVDVNTMTRQRNTPLVYHVYFRNEEPVVKYLIEHGADVNMGNPLYNALRYGYQSDMVKILIDAGANVNAEHHKGSLLSIAMRRGFHKSAGRIRLGMQKALAARPAVVISKITEPGILSIIAEMAI